MAFGLILVGAKAAYTLYQVAKTYLLFHDCVKGELHPSELQSIGIAAMRAIGISILSVILALICWTLGYIAGPMVGAVAILAAVVISAWVLCAWYCAYNA